MVSVPDWETLHRFGFIAGFLLALVVVWRLDRPRGEWGRRLRSRFVLGVPWGTLVTVAFVLGVYLFLQGGLAHWRRPLVVPFRAWSYFYPLGMATASFSHAGPNHLVGNLLGMLTFGTLAEYAWGHFPRRRGAHSFGSLPTNPFVRAFVVFPGAALVVGLVTSFFGLGPVVGFSSAVYAFAGFALVSYPIGTVLAYLVGNVLDLAYGTLLDPVRTASGRPAFITPWFADIALQGHALGFLLGVVLGLAFVSRRGSDRPTSVRVWVGALLFAITQSFWAVYWFRGNDTFVLYRGVGLALVAVLALLVAAAVTASDRPLLTRFRRDAPTRSFAAATAAVSARQTAVVVLVLAAAVLAGPAVPVNLVTVSDQELPGDVVSVRDYQVTYAEDVENGMVSVVDVDLFGESTSVNTSGVIVRSPDRGIWETSVTKGRLAFTGTVRVRVGGLGWRDEVVVERTGWKVQGAKPAYRVTLTHDGETETVYTTDPVAAEPIIDGRNVSVVATDDGFDLAVVAGNQTLTGPVPQTNESLTLDGFTFTRQQRKLFVVKNETRVRIATKERYE